MLRPAGSSLSLRASSIRNLNISADNLEEALLLVPATNHHLNQTEKNILKSLNNLHHLNLNHHHTNVNNIINMTSNKNINENDLRSDDINVNNNNNNINKEIVLNEFEIKDTNQAQTDSLATNQQIQVYLKRWIILAVFCSITLLNAFNWIEYSIIQDVVIQFYNESLPSDKAQQIDATNWFSMVYMLTYIPLVFPAMFLLDRKGLRLSCTLGALLTAVGSIIKCAAVKPNLFAVAMLAQTICGIAQSFTLGIPARLSALWFGPTEIATATSIGVFGNQLGTAIGFLIPPNVVKSDSIENMQRRFYYLLIPVACLCTLATILSIILVRDEPEKPPSMAQLEIRNNLARHVKQEQSDFQLFKSSLINLFKNLNFCLILISYGINTGTYYSIGTLLNQILIQYYPSENEKIGFIGLILVLSGLVGAVIGGIVLDKTKKFKLITFIIYACSCGAMILFTFTLSISIWIVFGTSFLLGFFMTGYLPVGFELAAEVTYPESEGTSCGLLNTSAQIFGIFYTYVQSRITTAHGALAGNIFVSASLLVGTIITALVKSDLRRQKAVNAIISNLNENDSSVNRTNETSTTGLKLPNTPPEIRIDGPTDN